MSEILVLGAGHNGLTFAAQLARAGHRVTVLERRSAPGGLAAREEFGDGYSAPGVLQETAFLRPDVVRELELERYGLAFRSSEPDVHVSNGTESLVLSPDADRTRTELARRSEKDAAAWADWRGYLARFRPFLERALNEPPPDLDTESAAGLWELVKSGLSLRRLGEHDMQELLRILPMCVADLTMEWFEDDLLCAALCAPAVLGTWTGPWSPGSAAPLLFRESTSAKSVRGGPAAVVDALVACFEAAGGTLRTEAGVALIRVRDGRFEGVVLDSGEELGGDVLGCAVDPKSAVLCLAPRMELPPDWVRRLSAFRTRGTSACLRLALNGPLELRDRPGEPVERLRLVQGVDALERAFDAVKYDRFSERPYIELSVPSLDDADLAPTGGHVAVAWVHFAPHHLAGGWTPEARADLERAAREVLAEACVDFDRRVVSADLLTPADLQQRFGLSGGHVHHGEHALDQVLHMRPTPESAFYATPVEGLYLCGPATHPGGGLTGAPGRLAARAVTRQARRR